ncbi:hypothetical protein K505DRAFT_260305 [Melanomma pulvis-pyrius CBS 109.77]|uniref:Uncharacterized protein n=1 Tax=Melanomma pulvis-pyrius CBS 109.77 TaxID=1314802 RepID=A0A6A6WQR5_9PLEO|nr:hypothetical protein K505DRAFT_260305 [Melanomma pulvis-pyrius CBS 109.77]
MSSPHPVPRAPAPWTTTSECYWLFVTMKELPTGVYDALEETRFGGGKLAEEREKVGEFKGGLGIVMVVRYSDTPVGPYDELILIPGTFAVPQPTSNAPPNIPKKALRIARIYVSQRTTTYNGRVNWNIPKHLARFTFSAPPTPAGSKPPSSLTVKVFPPGSKDGDGAGPFFACTLKPFTWIPSMPVSSRWLPVSTLHAQPPLPEGAGFKNAVGDGAEIDPYDISPEKEDSLLAGTDRWCSFLVSSYTPRARGCWVTIHKPGTGGEGDAEEAIKEAGKYWPQDVRPWGVGAWMEDAEMGFPEPFEWKL